MMIARTRLTVAVGDPVEVHACGASRPRHGEIVEVLDGHDRPHYRVRWDGCFESIVHPSSGMIVIGAVPVPRPPSP